MSLLFGHCSERLVWLFLFEFLVLSPERSLMSLFSLGEFELFTQSFAGVTLIDQWDCKVAKVGGKIFTLLGQNDAGKRIVFKCSEATFEILTTLDAVAQAPYFAKRQWISVGEHAPLSDAEMREYIRRSYTTIASGLTKKMKQELGVIIDLNAL